MGNILNLGIWDVILIVAVSVQATLLAYVHHPQWKSLIFSVPFPFTFGTLALGSDVNVTNVAALILLLLFTHGIRLLHYYLRVPIVGAIIITVLAYGAAGSALAPILPRTSTFFWIVIVLVFVMALFLYRITPYRKETGHRSALPVWLKLPIVAVLILVLIAVKTKMQGFFALFPMMGVITAYEARYSLWSMCRQIPVIMLTFLPMLIICYFFQETIGVGWSIVLGWIPFVAVLMLLTRLMWSKNYRIPIIEKQGKIHENIVRDQRN